MSTTNIDSCVHGFWRIALFCQDLDPRAYIRVPVKTTTMITGFGYLHGGVVTDPTLPVKNIKAYVQATSIGIARAFSLFGLTSQALVAVPYTWAQVSGEVGGLDSQITRSGLAIRACGFPFYSWVHRRLL